MTKLSFQRVAHDGVVCTGKLMIDNVVIETPNYFPILRTIKRPNELKLLMEEKGKNPLEHVSGGVVRLYRVAQMVAPHTEELTEQDKIKPKQTIFVGDTISNQSMYEIFYNDNLLLCDPFMESTYFINE